MAFCTREILRFAQNDKQRHFFNKLLDPSNPDTVYVGTGEENFSGDSYYGAGILKSSDGGATWTQLPGPFVGPFDSTSFFGGGARIGSVGVHPGNGLVLLAAVQLFGGDGIYRSVDGGLTWTQVLGGAPGTAVLFDPTNGDIAYAALGESNLFGSFSNGVYKSTDGGQTWSLSVAFGLFGLFTGRIALAIAPSNPATLYVAVQDSSPFSFGALFGFFKTTDGGQNYVQLVNTPDYCNPQCQYNNVVAVAPNDPNVVYAGGVFQTVEHTLIRSLDGGNIWSVVSTGANGGVVHTDTHALAFSSDGGRLYVGSDGGSWSTTDVTTTPINWASLNATLAITQFYPGHSISPTDVNTGFGGTQDNGTQKFAGSLQWNAVTCGDGGWTAIDFNGPSTVYATCQKISILKSTSNGNFGTWGPAQTGIDTSDRVQFIPPFVMDPSNSQTLYFGTFRVYKTNDGASSWTPISPDLTGCIFFCIGSPALTTIAVAASDSNIVYTGSSDGHVQVTTNAGGAAAASWTDQSAGLPPRYITQITVDPFRSATAYVTFSGFSGFVDIQGHVFRTTDGGVTWTDISGNPPNNLPNIPVNDIVVDPDVANTLYVATDLGVFGTSDGGATWSTLGTGLPRVAILGLKLHRSSRILRAATHGRSVWDLSIATGSNAAWTLPSSQP